MNDRAGTYQIIIYDARDPKRVHSTHPTLFAASKAARALNNERRSEWCYVWGDDEGQPYNPRYCSPARRALR